MDTSWESELAGFLTELSEVQEETLRVLTAKRALLAAADVDGLAAMAKQQEALIEKLGQCLRRREQLLRQAAEAGLPGDSIRSLANAVPTPQARRDLADRVRQAARRARLLQHQSLTNWLLVQRTLLHLSQILEIIATGGRMQPTYSKDVRDCVGGALVDRAV